MNNVPALPSDRERAEALREQAQRWLERLLRDGERAAGGLSSEKTKQADREMKKSPRQHGVAGEGVF